jgi:hypothetical protein
MSLIPAIGYPEKSLRFHQFKAGSLPTLYPKPAGQLKEWPPIQITYLDNYLTELKCVSAIEESHYIDRDYIEDLALFYARSLRSYPNHCRRLHFFSSIVDETRWREVTASARNDYERACTELTTSYLGFSVIRPLPFHPVGRTVLVTLGPNATDGKREFAGLRNYHPHLAGLKLNVGGLAFQQQDQGVSACATTAVWTALHGAAHSEALKVPTPSEITQAASRYLLMNGRTLPSEGLAIQQICEAIRDAGLAPVLVPATSDIVDRGVLDVFLRSGFPAVLAVIPDKARTGDAGHAICAVGMKIGSVQPQTNPDLQYRDGSTALKALYVHDDRLGPYAIARLEAMTLPDTTRRPQTKLVIKWPGAKFDDESVRLYGIVVPVPMKVRLPVTRLRAVAHVVGQAIGAALPQFERSATISARYVLGTTYSRGLIQSKISDAGLRQVTENLALSRYLGLIEVSALDQPVVDVILDCTEAVEEPSVIAVVTRSQLSSAGLSVMQNLATALGAPLAH